MLGHRTLAVSDYVSILKRRWLLVIIPAVLTTAIGYGLTFVIPPEYMSKTTVLIERQKVAEDYVRAPVEDNLDERLSSMSAQILSRTRLQPIIDRYNLYANQHLTPDAKLELTAKKIVVKPVPSEIPGAHGMPGFNISFKNSDPNTAKLVCGEITSLFINEGAKQQEAMNQGTTDFIRSQLEDAKKNLDEQDQKLADFQRQYLGRLPGEENTNISMLGSINTQLEAATEALTRMQQDKAYEEANLSQMKANAAAAEGATTQLPSSVTPAGPTPQELELQSLLAQESQLAEHYTDNYPDVVQVRRKIADLRKEIARTPAASGISLGGATIAAERSQSANFQQLQNQIHATDIGIDQKKRQQAELQTALKGYQDRISASPLVQEQYKEVTRDYQTAQTFYNNLLAELDRAKMSTALQSRQEGEQFIIMDPPNLPDTPTFPNPILFTVGGLVAGLVFGLGFIGILEYKDTALATERDIWEFTKLPTLAVIAYLPKDDFPDQPKRGFFSRLNPFSKKPQVAQT